MKFGCKSRELRAYLKGRRKLSASCLQRQQILFRLDTPAETRQ